LAERIVDRWGVLRRAGRQHEEIEPTNLPGAGASRTAGTLRIVSR